MNLRFSILFIFLLSIATSACSAYKSSGRKAFENKATGNNINSAANTGIAPAETKDTEDICWNQLAAEPLWHVDEKSSLIVTKLNDDEIQVCLQSP